MRIRNLLSRVFTDARGVATSLIEATATIAVGTVLAGVAINGGLDAIDHSKIEAAKSDVAVLGQAVMNFFKDNSFFPMFRDGTQTGPDDDYFFTLVSEDGTYASPDPEDSWRVGTPLFYTADAQKFGHIPALGHDTLEGHLVNNIINSSGNKKSFYPVRGYLQTDLGRGWNGPYVDRLPRTDPWGNKYMINVEEFSTKHIREFHAVAGQPLPRRAVIVFSAGPNRQIETSCEQPFETFRINGDDIAFRVR